jgi:D-sedoheptulose 7-phosphate isomerase
MAEKSLSVRGPSILDYLCKSRDVIDAALADKGFIDALEDCVSAISASLESGGKLLTCGNGGSAGDAQHIAGEFISRLNYDRPPTAAIALTVDTSVITAVGNDYGYDRVFERQVLGLGRRGDVLLAISTSGRSPSILRAMEAGRNCGMVIIGFTGRSGGDMGALSDILVRVPSDATPLIQQVHITAAHIVCGLVEEYLFPQVTSA